MLEHSPPSAVTDVDVAVIGGGFAGLLVADRLSSLGYTVTVAERSERLLAGTSSRNEGWLHAGTYHAVSIPDRREAVSVAQRCLTGWREYQARFPHAIEVEPARAVAVVPEERAAESESRWNEAGVSFDHLSRAAVGRLDPDVVIGPDEQAYAVADVGVQTRMVAASIVRKLRSRGVQIHLGVHAEGDGQGRLLLRSGGDRREVRHRFLVVAAGYGTESAARELGLGPVGVRLWRSHLLTVPRAAAMSVFSTAPGEASMMNHRDWSIIGLNEDATVVDRPTFDADPQVAAQLTAAVRRRFPRAATDRAEIRACVKVDYARRDDDPRSLNVRVLPAGDAAAVVLPGKMTEAPVVADTAAHLVFGVLGSPDIADRPIDLMTGGLAHV